MSEDDVIQSIEELFLREMEELRQDNAFLQAELNLVQRNLDGYIKKYEHLSQEYESALEALQEIVQEAL